jgi:choline dehydrogenase
VLPVFKQSEDYWRGADEMHGDKGEWRVEKQRLHWDVLDRYVEAAQQAGIPFTQDYNRGDNFGIGHFEVNQKKGVRWNASKAMLRPVQHRTNLKVVTGALIDRLVMDGREARGVEFSLGGHGNTRHRAGARIETVLTAGAIGSPAILQRSGIGPAALLQQHGVPLVHDLPGVGGNLQDHLQLRMIFKVHGIKTLNQSANSLWGKAMMAFEYALFRSGPLSMAPSQLGGFFRSAPEVPTPDLEFHVQPLSLDKFGDPLHPSRPSPPASATCGRVRAARCRIRDRDPGSAPKIAPNYLSTENDRQVAARALRLTRQVVAQPAMAAYRPEEFLPGVQFQNDEELAQAAGNIGTTIFHPTCTCAMGRADDAQAVVDPELRVRGIGRLRVVDASIMPTITSGNTNTPTIMIAERGAELIRAARKLSMSGPLIDYHNGIYAFDAGYVRPLLAAIHLIESEGRAAFVDTANFEVMPQALAALEARGLGTGQRRLRDPDPHPPRPCRRRRGDDGSLPQRQTGGASARRAAHDRTDQTDGRRRGRLWQGTRAAHVRQPDSDRGRAHHRGPRQHRAQARFARTAVHRRAGPRQTPHRHRGPAVERHLHRRHLRHFLPRTRRRRPAADLPLLDADPVRPRRNARLDRAHAVLQSDAVYLTHFSRLAPPAELGRKVLRLLDRYVDIALAASDADDKTAVIRDGLTRLLLDEARHHGCRLGPEHPRNLAPRPGTQRPGPGLLAGVAGSGLKPRPRITRPAPPPRSPGAGRAGSGRPLRGHSPC